MKKEVALLVLLGFFLFTSNSVIISTQGSETSYIIIKEDMLPKIETPSITFYENIGQVHDPLVKYYTASKSISIGFKPGSIILSVNGSRDFIELKFANGNSIEPEGVEQLHYPTHLFLGEYGSFTNIKSYKGVIYSQAWDDVDLLFDFDEKSLRFSLKAESTSDLEKVQFQSTIPILTLNEQELTFSDKNQDSFLNLKILEGGNLGSISRNDSISDFKINIDDKQFYQSQSIGGIIYTSTASGSDDDDYGNDVALDLEGNAYVVGEAQSNLFPTRNGYDSSVDYVDAFLTKFDGNNGDIVYSTVIGGSGREIGYAVAVDSEGNAYIGGSTNSNNYPLVNPYDGIYEGLGEAFLSKFGPNGDTLLFSTYLGGRHYTGTVTIGPGQAIYNLAVAPDNDIILSGFARTPNFPTIGGLNTSLAGSLDCFVAKMDTTNSRLVFSTLIGGSDYDVSYDLTVDESGTIYVAGYTESSDFPVASGYSETIGGESDAFFFILEKNGTQLLHSSYLGGSAYDQSHGIGIDSQGNIYVGGWSTSEDFPVTTGGLFSERAERDCFITKFNPDCSAIDYSIIFGGNDADEIEGMTVDEKGNVYVTGWTKSTNFITVHAPFYTTDDTTAAFLSKLNTTGDSFWYSTYLDCPFESGRSIMKDVEIDSTGNATVVGSYWPSSGYGSAQVIKVANIGDLDGDGVGDSLEELYGSNPYRADTDSDGLSDFEEIFIYGTDVNNPDTDSDSLSDGFEIQIGTDPLSPDSDGDGMIDSWEYENGFDPLDDEVPFEEAVLFYRSHIFLLVGGLILVVGLVFYWKKFR
ncbi:MAG: SBBP repeat-containing protein [Promethearchaeota archaeon]